MAFTLKPKGNESGCNDSRMRSRCPQLSGQKQAPTFTHFSQWNVETSNRSQINLGRCLVRDYRKRSEIGILE